MRLSQEFIDMLYRVPVILITFTVHELSHGFVAYLLGDDTAKKAGRLSLNPIRHIDPVGALMLIVMRFGWAKPVPINPNKFKKKKLGIILTSLAGPFSNLILALLTIVPFWLIYMHYGLRTSSSSTSFTDIVITFLFQFILVNISLGIFNLIPIPPLDGSKVLFALLPDRIYFNYVLRYERYGMILLLLLSFSGLLSKIMGPLLDTSIDLVLNLGRYIVQFFV